MELHSFGCSSQKLWCQSYCLSLSQPYPIHKWILSVLPSNNLKFNHSHHPTDTTLFQATFSWITMASQQVSLCLPLSPIPILNIAIRLVLLNYMSDHDTPSMQNTPHISHLTQSKSNILTVTCKVPYSLSYQTLWPCFLLLSPIGPHWPSLSSLTTPSMQISVLLPLLTSAWSSIPPFKHS